MGSNKNNSAIYVKTFFNPSLFWFVYDEDVPNRNIFNDELNKRSVHYIRILEPEIGMKIAVKYANLWVRAELVHTGATNPSSRNNVCWLIDFGIFTEVVDIYQLPKQFQFQPAFVNKAMLYGLKPNKKRYDFQKDGFVESLASTWEEGVAIKIKSILDQPNIKQRFVKECTLNDFIIGDIIITSLDLGDFCVTDMIAGSGLAEKDENSFKADLLSTEPPEISLQTIFDLVGCHLAKKSEMSSSSGWNCATKVQDELEEYGTCCSSNNSDTETVYNSPKNISMGRGKLKQMLISIEESHSNKEAEVSAEKPMTLSSSGRGFIKSKLQSTLNQDTSDVSDEKLFEDAVENEIKTSTPIISADRDVMKKFSDVNKENVQFGSNITVNKSPEKNKCAGRGFVKRLLEAAEQKTDENVDISSSAGRGIIRKVQKTYKSINETSSHDDNKFDDNLKFAGRGFIKSKMSIAASASLNKSELNTETKLPFTKHEIKNEVLQFQPAGAMLLNLRTNSSPKSSTSTDSSTKYDTATSTEIPIKKFTSTGKNYRKIPHVKRPFQSCNSSDSDDINKNVNSKVPSNSAHYEQNKQSINSPLCEQSNCNSSQLVTGRCDCTSCKSWRNNDMVFQKYPMSKARPKTRKKSVDKPSLLFKSREDEGDDMPHTKLNLNQGFENDVDMLIGPMLLVHGKIIPSPVENLENIPFNVVVKKNLHHLKYVKSQRIQTYTWPAIIRGDNVFIVNGPKSGKTMAYVPALSHFILAKGGYVKEPLGPLAIVLCPSSQVARDVHSLLQNMLNSVQRKQVALALPPLRLNRKNNILKSAPALVTTPRTLITLLREKIIKVTELMHIVLENASELFELFSTELETIFGVCQRALMKRTVLRSMQMIVVSQEWSHDIEHLASQLLRSPLICIGSYLEAAFYGRADIRVQFMESSAKSKKIIDIVEDNAKIFKTVIVCKEIEEVEETTKYLQIHGINYIAVHNNSGLDDINEANTYWSMAKSGAYRVLVCTDEVLSTSMCVVDASIVIQYSLPSTWTQFTYRFSTFIDNYKNPYAKETANNTPACKMHIFVDETNTEQFLKMVQLLKRLGCNLSENILKLYDEYLNKLEATKIINKIEICRNIKLFGTCKTTSSCEYRHALSSELDLSTNLPKSGIVKLKVLHVEGLATFYARLLEYIDGDNIVHAVEDKYAEIAGHMLNLANPKEQCILVDVKVDKLCALQESEGIFRRCKILEITKRGFLNKPLTAIVKLLDTGAKQSISVSNMYKLPDYLKDIPPQAVEVYVANLGAPDEDTSLTYQSGIWKELKKLDYENANCYFTGRIKLQLNNTIWVENLTLKEYLENGTLPVIKMSVRGVLLKNNLAENRPEHLKRLYDLCKKYTLNLPDYSLPVITIDNPVAVQAKPMWAHLENYEEYNLVHFCAAGSPDKIFLRLCSSQKSFDRLHDDIARDIHKPLYPTVFTVVAGHCYLAKDTVSDVYARVLVTKITDSVADCLFVDFGDFATIPVTELKFLSDDLIEQLPFQIIECKLWGIKPKNGEWSNQAVDVLYDYSIEPESGYLRFLQVKVMLHENPLVTGYKKYSVILINTHGTLSIINNEIVAKGYAELIENFDVVDLKKLMLKKEDKNENDDNSDNDVSNVCKNDEVPKMSSDEEWDFQCSDMAAYLRTIIKNPFTNQDKIQATNRKEITYDPEYKTMKALPAVGYSTPKVQWQQTNENVMLKIQLPNVTDYQIHLLRKRILSFKTECNNTTYRLDLNLFAKVESDIEHKSLGLYIQVKLKKQEPGEWERLVSGTKRLRNISYNIVVLSDEDDSDDEKELSLKKIQKLKQRKHEVENNSDFIYEIGSGSDYSESDIESDRESSDG